MELISRMFTVSIYLAVALIDGALEYLDTLALFTEEDALDDLLDDDDGGGREALGDFTLSNILMLLVSIESEIYLK